MGLIQTENKRICDELKQISAIKSVILIGSRSLDINQSDSDYDLYVVISTIALPFIFSKLKESERILEREFNAKISINPLTFMRLKNGNDLLLFKTKMEGTIICGNNYLNFINIKPDNITTDDLFSYLFSAIYFLIEYFNFNEVNDGSRNQKFIRNIAKSIIYCVDIELFLKGLYEVKLEKKTNKIVEVNPDNPFLNAIFISSNILNKTIKEVKDPQEFWFIARNYIFSLLLKLGEKSSNSSITSTSAVIENFKNSNLDYIKNIQFFILLMINKKKLHRYKKIFSISIEKNVYCAIFYLLDSVKDNSTVDKESIIKAYQIFNSIGLITKNNYHDIKSPDDWILAKNLIVEYWSMACGKRVI